jgi:hypothetical protein
VPAVEGLTAMDVLRGLYEGKMDYIKRNKLGGENNHWMIRARSLLATVERMRESARKGSHD